MPSLLQFGLFFFILLWYTHLSAPYKVGNGEVGTVDYLSNANLQSICNLNQPFIFDLNSVLDSSIYQDLIPENNAPTNEYEAIYIPESTALTIFESHFAPQYSFGSSSKTIICPNERDVQSHTFTRLFLALVPVVGQDSTDNQQTPLTIRITSWRNIRSALSQSDSSFIYSAINMWTDLPFTYTEVILIPGQLIYIPPYTWWSCKSVTTSKTTRLLRFIYMNQMNWLTHPWTSLPHGILPETKKIITTTTEKTDIIPESNVEKNERVDSPDIQNTTPVIIQSNVQSIVQSQSNVPTET